MKLDLTELQLGRILAACLEDFYYNDIMLKIPHFI